MVHLTISNGQLENHRHPQTGGCRIESEAVVARLSVHAPGLTTTESPFIEQAQRDGQLYITQPYDLYSEENHAAWRKLFERMLPRWQRYGNEHFLKGIQSLCLDPN